MVNKKPVLPLGAVTLALLGLALLFQFWPVSSCDQLEGSMKKGYFLRWMPPSLMLITADKHNMTVNADSKELACAKILQEITTPNG